MVAHLSMVSTTMKAGETREYLCSPRVYISEGEFSREMYGGVEADKEGSTVAKHVVCVRHQSQIPGAEMT